MRPRPPADVPSLLRRHPAARVAAGFALFWTAVGVLFALPTLDSGGAGHLPLWRSLAEWWSWGLLAPLIVRITHAVHVDERQNGVRLLAHAILGLLVAALALYLSTAFSALFGVVSWQRLVDPSLPGDALRGGFLWGLVVYGLIAGVAEASLNSRRFAAAALRAEQVERVYADARLHALRLQLDPHFLFNALNTISAEVTRDARSARAMIEHLATLLRLSLDKDSRHAVPLVDELAMLEHYLAIQRARFGDRLTVRLDVPEALNGALVPSLLIQPLVENAVRHGLAPRRAGGTVAVTASRDGDHLLVTVSDDGVGLPTDWPDGGREGVGLSVTRERIEQFGPAGAGRIEIRRRPEGGTDVALSLPFLAVPLAADA